MLKDAKLFSSFSVLDLAEAQKFYGETLGLAVSKTPEGLEIKTGGPSSIFIYESPNNKPADFTVLNLVVTDVDEAVAELAVKGITMERYDMPGVKTDEKGVARSMEGGPSAIAWFKDPAGNIVSVMEDRKK